MYIYIRHTCILRFKGRGDQLEATKALDALFPELGEQNIQRLRGDNSLENGHKNCDPSKNGRDCTEVIVHLIDNLMANPNEIRLPAKWIELNLTKKECASFIGSAEDETLCQCGRRKIDHGDFVKHLHHPETWNPSLHTKSFPTDAYGSLIFEGEQHPNKAHFVRLSYDTNPEIAIQLMTLVWGIEMPKLLITVHGGNSNFELPSRLGKVLHLGLIKAAKSCNAWIFTGGLNDGVAKHIGTALNHEHAVGFRRGGRVVAVGIAPWGLVEHREELRVKNKDKIYSALEHAQSKFRLLNPKHSNFLLVDNGSLGKMGGEMYFRRRLEKCISRYPTSPHRGCDIPVICIVIEGGFYTLRTIGDYLHDEPSTPVVVFAGTGRTADLLGWVMRKVQQLPQEQNINSLRDEVHAMMMKLYRVNPMQCTVLFAEIKRIMIKKDLVTIYSHTSEEDFDAVVLASLFRSQHWTPLQQLSLALVWDRVDIAESEVFTYGREWSTGNLEHAMMEALVCNRLDFVRLLLEHGLNMQNFLTVTRLEALYNTDNSKLLKMLVSDLAQLKSNKQPFDETPIERKLTIHDVGIAISHMMGHIYKSNYIHMTSKQPTSSVGAGYYNGDDKEQQIKLSQPFDDLFIWSVLTKRHTMALLLWGHGQGALVKSLVAVKLNKFIAGQLADKTDTTIAMEFENYATEWEGLAFELVDTCFKQDQKQSRQLLTMELDRWSKMTCLTLAVMSNHRMLLGHPCCQILLADLWMGALNLKSHSTLKVILGIVFPFLIFFLDFKSTEELKLLPHQERPPQGSSSHLNEMGLSGWNERESESASLRTYNSKSRSLMMGSIFQKSLISNVLNSQEVPKPDEDLTRSWHHRDGPAELSEEHRTPHDKPHRHVTIQSDDASIMSMHKNNERTHSSHKQRSSFITTRQRLQSWKKLYEFQKAPVTNFYRHAMAYLLFVCLLAYLILVPQDRNRMGYVEMYVVAYLGSLGMEVCRDFIAIDALNWSQKLVEFKTHVWQIFDFAVICFFMIGTWLRFTKYFEHGMLIYRVSSIYWNLRLYKYMGVHRFVGPKIVMMSKMLKHMAYFAMIILVVIIAFGMAREAIRFPDTYPTWRNIAEAFLEPYVMMFGEVDTDALSPQCGDGDSVDCPVGYWIIPLTWAVYMMVANILIVNVLIAVFNGIYSEIDSVSLEVWMFQRFTFVMEFEEKPLLPPPAIILCHIYGILKWIYKKTKLCMCEQELEIQMEDDEGPKIIMGNDHRLKTFLTSAEASIVYDFEEDSLVLINVSKVNIVGAVVDDNSGFDAPQLLSSVANSNDSRDRKGIQQLKNNFRDICAELEVHRAKLDKLLSYWEIEQETRETESLDEEESSHSITYHTTAVGDDNIWNKRCQFGSQ